MNAIDIIATVIIAVSAPEQFYGDVAARCNGEAPFALRECAATVRNRVSGGISPEHVLNAYYAEDKPYTKDDVDTVRGVFSDNENPQWWFMLGKGIDDHWRPPHGKPPMHTVCRSEAEKYCVLFFSRYGEEVKE